MDAYDYGLPESAIAQVPAEPRTSARLLDATDPGGTIVHRRVDELPALVRPGDLLVVNETRVMPARLFLEKETGGRVEVLLVEDRGPAEGGRVWEAMVRPLKRCPPGTVLSTPGSATPAAVVGERCGDGTRALVVVGAAAPAGELALPPYVHVPLADPERYQTVYARTASSVAAPTAGLHFTTRLLQECQRAGADLARVDLSVGIDTFRPITAERVDDHVMHSERYSVPEATLEACERAERVWAVGTTTVRALESAAATGRLEGRTDLFIHGGYRFRMVDVLMTNFHMPRSTLLLLVESFAGCRWRDLYQTALERGYRFLSFGDVMVVGRG